MKTIGLVGGLTYVSTLVYYQLINEMVNQRLGGAEAAKIIIYSVNFAEIKTLTQNNNWSGIAAMIGEAAKKLERAGADCILLGANTMHNIADEVQAMITLPLIHIAQETGKIVASKKIKKVALLGTQYTMQLDFYKTILTAHGISTIIPNESEIHFINHAIYEEMSKNLFTPATKAEFLNIINRLAATESVEGVILGCTEIPVLLEQADCTVKLFDTTKIHAQAAVNFALA